MIIKLSPESLHKRMARDKLKIKTFKKVFKKVLKNA